MGHNLENLLIRRRVVYIYLAPFVILQNCVPKSNFCSSAARQCRLVCEHPGLNTNFFHIQIEVEITVFYKQYQQDTLVAKSRAEALHDKNCVYYPTLRRIAFILLQNQAVFRNFTIHS